MKLKIHKDNMGYNWLLCSEGLVLAFGALKSFDTPELAKGAYDALVYDVKHGVTIPFELHHTIGMYKIDTPEDSPIRYAGLFTGNVAAMKHVKEIENAILET